MGDQLLLLYSTVQINVVVVVVVGANAPNGTFSTLYFATAREREGRDRLVAKTIYFNITKLLRPGNIANGAQNPFKSIKFAILSRSSF